jgi:superfamily II DNA/RNA helicase/very-short-patch-repair endonuclease
VQRGLLHPRCADIFRAGKSPDRPEGADMRLHKHQTEAIEAARARENYVLTTGTGSGKSLSYIVPIVDHVLRAGSGNGIQAIVVYPMNALANSQREELKKFLYDPLITDDAQQRPAVTFARYTGQETRDEKLEIQRNPPDILLTNYVMLELILTRGEDQILVDKASALRFLVLDELHTYRGRQGADVALLIRRLRQACNAPDLRCVGTSATMSSEGGYEDRKKTVATVASLLFGDAVDPTNVVGETLRRATPAFSADDPAQIAALAKRVRDADPPSTQHKEFVADPLSSWIESTLGIAEDEGGRLARVLPLTIRDAATRLANLCKLESDERAAAVIREQLLAGNSIPRPDSPNFNVFAFRLHQFVSRGDTVYLSLDTPGSRTIRMREERADPQDANTKLFGQVFCRACGQEYSTVHWEKMTNELVARHFDDRQTTKDRPAGYLFISEENPWPSEPADMIDLLPEEWIDWSAEPPIVTRNYRQYIPEAVDVDKSGRIGSGVRAWFIPTPFRFCLACSVSFTGRRSEPSKLATLGSGGRSSATTVMSMSTVRWLRHHLDDHDAAARKLLAFSDNRQDASLQAGHFNDFVQTIMLRAGLRSALVKAGDAGLQHDELAQRVFDALNLPPETYMKDVLQKYGRDDAGQALRSLLEYRLYIDFLQGFRFNQPNLEFTGLLAIEYRQLSALCADEDDWQNTHVALTTASPAEREQLATVALDWMRREVLIEVDALKPEGQERMQRRTNEHLADRWRIGIDPREIHIAGAVRLRPRRKIDDRYLTFLSPRGSLGRFIRRWAATRVHGKITTDDVTVIISQLFERLVLGGLLTKLADEEPTYRLKATALLWKAGDGDRQPDDPLRVSRPPVGGLPTNPYFRGAYESLASDLAILEAREHTAQVPQIDRQEREDRFRAGSLPVMYCSPTMELGVDIADLNVVGMRNVPPTPANYAQRSGRAGRGGQPAMVFTYCTSGSPHDQFYFKDPVRMVSGQVAAPRIELANEDLVRSHIHAVWLARGGLHLEPSLKELLNLDHIGEKTPVLQASKEADVDKAPLDRSTRAAAIEVMGSIAEHLQDAPWFDDEWLDQTIAGIPRHFRDACQRWWDLYTSARNLAEAQDRVIRDHTRKQSERKEAQLVRRQAEQQMMVLEADSSDVSQSDFQSYRYFASEGFLPGYSFPRLPVVAWVDSTGGRSRVETEALQRPRFLAINEFGPRALIYHEGRRHRITRIDVPRVEQADGIVDVASTRAKRCPKCGHLHNTTDGTIVDNCEACKTPLDTEMSSLLRLQKVHTTPVDRISSDEEERQRQGYEIISGYRFARRDGQLSRRKAIVTDADGEPLATLQFGDTATLWRMNLGWRRRKEKQLHGFILDVDKGRWATNQDIPEGENDDKDDPLGNQTRRVIPYVEDTRNILLLEPKAEWTIQQMASVQSALKRAIQATFELEDNELAVEPLPNTDVRRFLLFWESAEGGAGVLRLLLDRPRQLAAVIDEALRTCHVDPDTLLDDPGSKPCSLACYECLLSYTNQPDHAWLDRQATIETLSAWRECRVDEVSATTDLPDEQFEQEKSEAESGLERLFLDFLQDQGAKIPERGRRLETLGTTPDMWFPEAQLLIYIDGPVHDFPDRRKRDAAINEALRDAGWRVVRFGHADDWPARLDEFADYFGVPA